MRGSTLQTEDEESKVETLVEIEGERLAQALRAPKAKAKAKVTCIPLKLPLSRRGRTIGWNDRTERSGRTKLEREDAISTRVQEQMSQMGEQEGKRENSVVDQTDEEPAGRPQRGSSKKFY